ncbi:MAG: hypothetical protein HYU78_03245 [Rhodocyclales bacterium]|nr:hypothetical protein [Rhodocyclales bacterium]
MLALKLVLVPSFLLFVSLAGRRWGAAVAGRLVGLPLVTGPILFFLSVEQGERFAAAAAGAALSAVFAAMAFGIVYARSAQRRGWPATLLLALPAWLAAALPLTWLPASPLLALLVALPALALAPRLFPAVQAAPGRRQAGPADLLGRMLAGAVLTLVVTAAAETLGQTWSGLLAMFPILATVITVATHRAHGAVDVAVLLRATAGGYYAIVAFCFVLAIALPALGNAGAFALAVAACLAAQATSWRRR